MVKVTLGCDSFGTENHWKQRKVCPQESTTRHAIHTPHPPTAEDEQMRLFVAIDPPLDAAGTTE
jgi:hypothetical protein